MIVIRNKKLSRVVHRGSKGFSYLHGKGVYLHHQSIIEKQLFVLTSAEWCYWVVLNLLLEQCGLWPWRHHTVGSDDRGDDGSLLSYLVVRFYRGGNLPLFTIWNHPCVALLSSILNTEQFREILKRKVIITYPLLCTVFGLYLSSHYQNTRNTRNLWNYIPR